MNLSHYLALTLVVAGCGEFGPALMNIGPACSADSDCQSGELCFPEGCGNPGSNVVVEITANTKTGHHAQDIPVGELGANQNISVFSPIALIGEVQRKVPPPAPVDATTPFTGAATVRAVGESALIPGVSRRYEANFSSLDPGAFSMFVGAGRYTVTFSPLDASIPEEVQEGLEVTPESNSHVWFVLTAPGGAMEISGRLLQRYKPGPPVVETPITQAAMEIQAIDPDTLRPLSQPAPVASGYPTSKGEFTLYLPPSAAQRESILLWARPANGSAAVPFKTFALKRPFPSPLVLELGDFGELMTQVTGTLHGTDGRPVVGAAVFLEGEVNGGGVFRTKTVVTDSSGVFRVEAFPSAPNSFYRLTARPQSDKNGSSSSSVPGILQRTVKVLSKANAQGQHLEPSVLVCPDRVPVVGSVLRPTGQPAIGVRVLAHPLSTINGNLLPDPVETETDQNAQYWLNLDPGTYRLDYLPGEDLPLRSRIVEVRAEVGVDGKGMKVLDLNEFTLANGRTIAGTVHAVDRLSSQVSPTPNATLRFFRVTNVGGKRSALLLGQTVADERGRYSVVIPTR